MAALEDRREPGGDRRAGRPGPGPPGRGPAPGGSRYGWLFAGALILGLAWLKSCAIIDVAPRRHHPLLLQQSPPRGSIALGWRFAGRP